MKNIIIYKGIKCRDTFMDKWIIDEMDNRFDADYSYILQNVEGKTVLDIGANIGAFTKRALDNKALRVISVEPNKENFSLLVENTKDSNNSYLYRRAVTMEDDKDITLYINKGSNKGLHSILKDSQVVNKGNYTTEVVQTISLMYLLEKYKPEVLKIDIEGAEIYLESILQDLPKYVKYIAIEFDTNTKYLTTYNSLVNTFEDKQANKFFTGIRR